MRWHPLDLLERHEVDEYQRIRLRWRLYEAYGTPFQAEFEKIMVRLSPGFARVPMGGGDGGNDGWIKKLGWMLEGTNSYFQVYAPTFHKYDNNKAINKLEIDAKNLVEKWDPQFEIKTFIYLVKCQVGITKTLYDTMRRLESQYGFQGDVVDAVPYLEHLVECSGAEATMELAGPPEPDGGRRADVEVVDAFLARTRPVVTRVRQCLHRSFFPADLFHGMVDWLMVDTTAGTRSWLEKHASNNTQIRGMQQRLVKALFACRDAVNEASSYVVPIGKKEGFDTAGFLLKPRCQMSTLFESGLIPVRERIDEQIGIMLGASCYLHEYVKGMSLTIPTRTWPNARQRAGW